MVVEGVRRVYIDEAVGLLYCRGVEEKMLQIVPDSFIPIGSRKIVGFTGTRRGMTSEQETTFAAQLVGLTDPRAEMLVHGDCLGADAQAHAIARRLGLEAVAYPANIPGMRAFTDAGTMASPAPPLERNKRIVGACGLLIATPARSVEEQRSGTWATIRYARRQGKHVIIIWPDGSATIEAGIKR